MSTRLKRSAIWRHIAVALGLVAFQGYLAYSVMTGQFGIESQDVLEAEIEELGAQSAALQAEMDFLSPQGGSVPVHPHGPGPRV